MKIILGAVLSRHPYIPGSVWNRMQYACGLRALGHEVHYVEEVSPGWCVDALGNQCRYEHSINRAYFEGTMRRFGLLDQACQLFDGGNETAGLSRDAIAAAAREADLLINMSGHVKADLILANVRRRAYLDQDPVYTQLWISEYGADLNFGAHDVFVSVGLNIGTPHSPIPDCGVRWHHLLPPVVLEHWPARFDPSCQSFTTIASWGGHSDLKYRGQWYRSKRTSFRRFAALPQVAGQRLEIALRDYETDGQPARMLQEHGWHVVASGEIGDLDEYRSYIARSRAEICIAKHAYVRGCSGWFSDRSAQYLAMGKPVLAQSTGFERYLPVGLGLVAFSSMAEAAAGVEAINQDYVSHCRAAREIAEEHLDYRKVLPRLLEVCDT